MRIQIEFLTLVVFQKRFPSPVALPLHEIGVNCVKVIDPFSVGQRNNFTAKSSRGEQLEKKLFGQMRKPAASHERIFQHAFVQCIENFFGAAFFCFASGQRIALRRRAQMHPRPHGGRNNRHVIAQVAVELTPVGSGPNEFVAVERRGKEISRHVARRIGSLAGNDHGLLICRAHRGNSRRQVLTFFAEEGEHGGGFLKKYG